MQLILFPVKVQTTICGKILTGIVNPELDEIGFLIVETENEGEWVYNPENWEIMGTG